MEPIEIEPFSHFAAAASAEVLADALFASCDPGQILEVWKILRESFEPAIAEQSAACLWPDALSGGDRLSYLHEAILEGGTTQLQQALLISERSRLSAAMATS